MTTEYVYKKYSIALYAVIFRIIDDKEVAEIVFHNSFVKIVLKIDEFEWSYNRLYTWMADICRASAFENILSKEYPPSVEIYFREFNSF